MIAHEISHIVRSHMVAQVFTRVFAGMAIKACEEAVKYTVESKEFFEFLRNLLKLTVVAFIAKEAINVNVETVKRQELEADKDAVSLVGCKSARISVSLLNRLRKEGYNVSHEAILGFPALTIEERIENIKEICP